MGNSKLDINKLKNISIRGQVHSEINEWAVKEGKHLCENKEEIWDSLKNKVWDINKTLLKTSKCSRKEIWMTDEIMDLMEERRMYKSKDSDKYKDLDKKIRREARRARNKWYEQRCDYVEYLMKKHDFFSLHKEVKNMAGINKKYHNSLLEDNLGNLILDVTAKKDHWEQYIKELYSDNTRGLINRVTEAEGPDILKSEVMWALTNAKSGKATGPDNVNVEVLKLLEPENISVLVQLYNYIYSTGIIPDDWLKSTFIPLPKKKNSRKCHEFRTISLMSHILKTFLKIIHKRIRIKCEEPISENQFGFRAGMGTREAQFALNVLVQKCRDMQQDVYLCFIDYEKAFDRVQHEVLMKLLMDTGIDTKDVRIIMNLYWEQTASIRVDRERTEAIKIEKGVRQGCILSPLLFNLYSEYVIKEAMEDIALGVTVNGQVINNLRYADDTVLIASTQQDLQEIVSRVNECSERVGLRMNALKTKYMVISGKSQLPSLIKIGNTTLEKVDRYKYLGSWLTESWKSDTDIRVRIEIARASFMKMEKVLCGRQLSLKLRIRLLQSYIWPVVLYGCEAWTLVEELRRKIEAFEMWAYRRMLRISWTAKISNAEVLTRIQKKTELVRSIKQRKIAYLGHVLRNNKYRLLQTIMMGKIAGKRRVGRRKKSWLRNIREWTGIKSVGELFRLARDKERFKKLTADLQ